MYELKLTPQEVRTILSQQRQQLKTYRRLWNEVRKELLKVNDNSSRKELLDLVNNLQIKLHG